MDKSNTSTAHVDYVLVVADYVVKVSNEIVVDHHEEVDQLHSVAEKDILIESKVVRRDDYVRTYDIHVALVYARIVEIKHYVFY